MATARPTGTHRAYLTGLVLALILTVTPFELVYFGVLPKGWTIAAIAVAAILQVIVHLRYFLHVDFRITPGENLAALAFTAFLICVMVGGSLWIMFDLHYRMQM